MTKKIEITLKGYRCNVCGHEWIPRSGEIPKLCPKCHSARWDREPRAKIKT